MAWQLSLMEEAKTFPCIWNTRSRGFKEAPRNQLVRKIMSQRLNMEGTVTTFVFLSSKILLTHLLFLNF